MRRRSLSSAASELSSWSRRRAFSRLETRSRALRSRHETRRPRLPAAPRERISAAAFQLFQERAAPGSFGGQVRFLHVAAFEVCHVTVNSNASSDRLGAARPVPGRCRSCARFADSFPRGSSQDGDSPAPHRPAPPSRPGVRAAPVGTEADRCRWSKSRRRDAMPRPDVPTPAAHPDQVVAGRLRTP